MSAAATAAPPRACLLLRADAAPRTGTGHVMRALALAQAWQDAGGRAVLASADLLPALAARLAAEGVGVAAIEAAPGSAADAAATAALARRVDAAAVAADGYPFDAAWQRAVREAGAPLLCADDDAQIGGWAADLVVDPNPDVDVARYAARAPHVRLLLGTAYAPLRREFAARAARRRDGVSATVRRVLVTLGGADPDGVTRTVLRGLGAADGPPLEVRVVIGAANPHGDAIRAEAAAAPLRRHAVSLLHAVDDMPSLMAWADVALSAAGSTCWELAFMGLPTAVVVLAENQRRIAGRLAAAGVVHDVGDGASLDAAAVAAALARLAPASTRDAMRQRGQRLVDGGGAARLVGALRALPAAAA